jgi:hypothetical protein
MDSISYVHTYLGVNPTDNFPFGAITVFPWHLDADGST